MAYDTFQTLEPPKPILSGGTAVQVAGIGDEKWEYDNDNGNWVNLKTGEAVSPEVFSRLAGGSENAAKNTMALASAMRQEEAQLTRPSAPPIRRAPVIAAPAQTPSDMPPMFDPNRTPPSPSLEGMRTPVLPPREDMPQNPAVSAPVIPPQSPMGQTPVSPPRQFVSPEDLARVAAQRPIPGTRTPPSSDATRAYNLQAYQRAVAMGMPEKTAAGIYLPGILQAQTRPIQVSAGNSIYDPKTRTFIPGPSKPVVEEKPKVHFGPNGQVLREKGGAVEVIRPPDPGKPKYHGVNTKVPADQFGPEISGPSDHPDIMARVKLAVEAAAKLDAADKGKPDVWKKVTDFFRHDSPLQDPRGTTAAAATPVVTPPTGVTTPEGKPKTKEQKLARGKVLAAQHPEWTKQEIIDAVNAEAK